MSNNFPIFCIYKSKNLRKSLANTRHIIIHRHYYIIHRPGLVKLQIGKKFTAILLQICIKILYQRTVTLLPSGIYIGHTDIIQKIILF